MGPEYNAESQVPSVVSAGKHFLNFVSCADHGTGMAALTMLNMTRIIPLHYCIYGIQNNEASLFLFFFLLFCG